MARLTYAEVRDAWLDDSYDLYQATQAQISSLCDEVGDDRPQMRWDDMQAELEHMRNELAEEFRA